MEEALKAMDIAKQKIKENDYTTAKTFANNALNLYPQLNGLKQVLIMIDVFISAANKTLGGVSDWYGVLGVDPLADDELIKKQYKKLALLLHPDKNNCEGAEEAFKLILEACSLLTDKYKRIGYDQKRKWEVVVNTSNGCYEKQPPPPNPYKEEEKRRKEEEKRRRRKEEEERRRKEEKWRKEQEVKWRKEEEERRKEEEEVQRRKEEEKKKLAAEFAMQQKKAKEDSNEKKKKNQPWSKEEIDMLRKGTIKYPKGTFRRWEVISEYIGTGRSVEEILKATKTVLLQKPDSAKAFDYFLEKRKPSASISSPLSTRQEELGESPIPTSTRTTKANQASSDKNNGEASGSSDTSDGDGWLAVEERVLVQALKTFHKEETTQRWEKVAAAVPGKTVAQCKKKFAELKEIIRKNKTKA